MAKNYQKVLNDVLIKIEPTAEEKKLLENLSKKTLDIANKEAKKVNAKAIIAGSLTRSTWLKDKNEFDIFILFPKSLSEKKLEKIGLELGRRVINKLKGKWRIEYAQHPYVRGKVENILIDIVPCYRLRKGEKIKSAVDRTPFHVDYINNNLPEKLTNDVRLLKQFCKANNIYGADAKTEGFSGYVCELLAIKYGKFLNIMKNAIKWKSGDVIDIEKYYNKEDYSKLRKKFKRQVLILIDPTDKNRNTAAAISSHSFYIFKKMAKIFLLDPSDEFFFEEKHESITENELIATLIKRRTELILVTFKAPKVVPDILWPQLRRLAERLEQILKDNEFVVLRKDIYTDEKKLALVLLEMEVSKLPSVIKRTGPLIFDHDDSKRFIQKYNKEALAGPFIENGYWCVETNRDFLTAREKLFHSLKEKSKILKEKGIPNHIADEISKKFDIICGTDRMIEIVNKDGNFGIFLKRYFTKGSLV